MSRTNYKKETIATVGFLILNLAILLAGGWFITSKIINSSAQLAEKKSVMDATQKNWGEISLSQKDLQAIKPQLEKIDGSFISNNQPIEFINLLETLAQRTNSLFEINLMSLGADSNKKENSILFQISLTGTFGNLMHFLNYLENMKYLVQIQSVDVSQVAGGVARTNEGQEIPAGSVYSIINLKAYTK
jgi:hypothetical protein